ncbi:MAG: hypothetical protein AAGE80_00860 [Pseudomonadota bacterium]
MSGYTTAKSSAAVSKHIENAQFPHDGDLEITESLGGMHSIFATRSDGAVVFRSKPACSSAYYGRGRGFIIACNRPTIVAPLLCSGIEPAYLEWLIATGFPLDDTTPYQGVKCLLGHQALRIRGSCTDLVSYTLAGQGSRCRGDAVTAERQTDFENELLRASAAVSRFKRVELRLSGGKDSRLIAAALAHQRLDVDAHTRGTSEDADIATEIARIAGFPIHRSIAEHRAEDVDHFEEQALEAISWSDGLIEFETHVALERPEALSPGQDGIIFGHSHLQKGGFAKSMAATSPEKAQETLRRSYIPRELEPRHQERFLAPIAHLFDPKRYAAPIDMLYEPYSLFRIGRYIEPLYLKLARFQVPIFPLNDERFFLACSRMNRHHRTREIACHAAVNAFSPAMLGIPFYQDKWRFEPGSAMPSAARDAHSTRPVVRQIPFEFLDHARLRLKGSRTLEMATGLLTPGFLAQCGFSRGSAAQPPTNATPRLVRKTILRLYLLHLLETKFSTGTSASLAEPYETKVA